MPDMPNDKRCPLCKVENNCMMLSEEPCWCVKADIPSSLIDLVPADLQRKSCICLSCVTAYHENQLSFISSLKES
jgi:polyferredoxin